MNQPALSGAPIQSPTWMRHTASPPSLPCRVGMEEVQFRWVLVFPRVRLSSRLIIMLVLRSFPPPSHRISLFSPPSLLSFLCSPALHPLLCLPTFSRICPSFLYIHFPLSFPCLLVSFLSACSNSLFWVFHLSHR